MADKKLGLNYGVRQIIERLFSDDIFKEDALANPELAFAHYSLDEEERQALKGLLSHRSALTEKDAKQLSIWY
jgi:hypothetical protein